MGVFQTNVFQNNVFQGPHGAVPINSDNTDTCATTDTVIAVMVLVCVVASGCTSLDSNTAIAVTQSTVTDTGTTADSSTTALGTTVLDTGPTTDTNTTARGTTVTDTSTSTDSSAIIFASTVPDTAASADSNSRAYTSPFTDTGPTADSNAITLPITVTDTSTSADTNSRAYPSTFIDTSTSADSSTVTLPVTAADTSTTTDSNTAGSGTTSAVTDTSTSADSDVVATRSPVTDSSASADSTAAAFPVTVADSGASSDSASIAITFVCTVADAGSTSDSNTTSEVGGVAQSDNTDATTSADSSVAAIGSPVIDAAASTDSSAISFDSAIADSGSSTDSASISTASATTDTGTTADGHSAVLFVRLSDACVATDSNVAVGAGDISNVIDATTSSTVVSIRFRSTVTDPSPTTDTRVLEIDFVATPDATGSNDFAQTQLNNDPFNSDNSDATTSTDTNACKRRRVVVFRAGVGAASSASGTINSMPAPAGSVSGDLQIAIIGTSGSSTGVVGGAEWTKFLDLTGGIHRVAVFFRLYNSAIHTATSNWSVGAVGIEVVIGAFTGHDTVYPIDAVGTGSLAANVAASPLAFNPVTLTYDGSMVAGYISMLWSVLSGSSTIPAPTALVAQAPATAIDLKGFYTLPPGNGQVSVGTSAFAANGASAFGALFAIAPAGSRLGDTGTAASDTNRTTVSLRVTDACASTETHRVFLPSGGLDTSTTADSHTVEITYADTDSSTNTDAQGLILDNVAADATTDSEHVQTQLNNTPFNSTTTDTSTTDDAAIVDLTAYGRGTDTSGWINGPTVPSMPMSGGGTVVANADVAPDGSLTAFRVTEPASGVAGAFFWGVGNASAEVGQGDVLTFSASFKAESMRYIDFGRSAYGRLGLDLQTGVFQSFSGAGWVYIASGTSDEGNGWWRYWLTVRITYPSYQIANLIVVCRDSIGSTITYVPTGRSYLGWRPRVERGVFGATDDVTVGLDARASGVSYAQSATKSDLIIPDPETTPAADSNTVTISAVVADTTTSNDTPRRYDSTTSTDTVIVILRIPTTVSDSTTSTEALVLSGSPGLISSVALMDSTSGLASIRDSVPAHYWRLGEAAGSFADLGTNPVALSVVGTILRGAAAYPTVADGNLGITFGGASDSWLSPGTRPADMQPGFGRPFSASCFVRLGSNTTTTRQIFGTAYSDGSTVAGWEVISLAGGRVGFSLFSTGGTQGASRQTEIIDAQAWANWHHIVLTYDGGDGAPDVSLCLYVDGVQQTTSALSPWVPATPGTQWDPSASRGLLVGSRSGTIFSPFRTATLTAADYFDELAIWSRALSEADVRAIMARPAPASGPVLEIDLAVTDTGRTSERHFDGCSSLDSNVTQVEASPFDDPVALDVLATEFTSSEVPFDLAGAADGAVDSRVAVEVLGDVCTGADTPTLVAPVHVTVTLAPKALTVVMEEKAITVAMSTTDITAAMAPEYLTHTAKI